MTHWNCTRSFSRPAKASGSDVTQMPMPSRLTDLLQSGRSVRRQARALERRYTRLQLCGIGGHDTASSGTGGGILCQLPSAGSRGKPAGKTLLRQRAQHSQAQAESAEKEARRQLQAMLYETARALVLSKEVGHRAPAVSRRFARQQAQPMPLNCVAWLLPPWVCRTSDWSASSPASQPRLDAFGPAAGADGSGPRAWAGYYPLYSRFKGPRHASRHDDQQGLRRRVEH